MVRLVIWSLIVCLILKVCHALYRTSPFHPLHRFPGPRIAAATYAYEAYHDWYLGGRYTKKIACMHKEYGPIIRINPDELHCSDPAFTDEIYAGPGRKRNRWQHHLNTGGAGPVSETGFSTVSHDLHRKRRESLARFFSSQRIQQLEHEVSNFAKKTTDKMLAFAGKGVFDVKEAFNCVTADIISQYAFDESMGFVEQDGWEPNFSFWVKPFFASAYMMRHNVFARNLAHFMPFIASYLGQDVQTVLRIMNVTIPGYINAALQHPEHGRAFAEMMGSQETLSDEEKYRFKGEGFNLLLAGTETTTSILTVFTFWVLAKPAVYDRLVSDLSAAKLNAQNFTWAKLEQCPYLWATLHECLRMTPGVSHRSARIAPEEVLHYKSADGKSDYPIPRNTPISMTSMINHWDTNWFPDPDEFKPERWLLGIHGPTLNWKRF